MPLMSQKNCGCNCRNLTEWGPTADGLPVSSCPNCSSAGTYNVGTGTAYVNGGPCEMIAIFDCPIFYDGLDTRVLGPGSTLVNFVPLIKEKLVIEDCRYTLRKLISDQGTGSSANPTGTGTGGGGGAFFPGVSIAGCDIDFIVEKILNRAYRRLFNSECKHPNDLGVPQWAQYFPGVAVGSGSGNAAYYYDTPRFGCKLVPNPLISQAPPLGCGWYDLLGMALCGGDAGLCQDFASGQGTENYSQYLQILDRYTRIAWDLDFNSAPSATLTGTTDGGEQIVFSTSSWVCGARNTLELTTSPNPSWNKAFKVCIVPGETGFTTPCTDKENVTACCDPGVTEGQYYYNSPGCNLPTLGFCATRYASLAATPAPDWVKAAQGSLNGSCGVFYDSTTYDGTCAKPPPMSCPSGTGAAVVQGTWDSAFSDFTIHLLTWCDAGVWKSSLFCEGPVLVSGNAGFVILQTAMCLNVNCTMVRCHPVFGYTWTCDAPATYTIPSGTGSAGCVTRAPCCCKGEETTGTIDTACCPDNLLQDTLTGELSPDPTNPTACTGYDQSGSLTHSTTGSGPSLQHFWSGTISDCGTTYHVKITCDGSTWKAKVWEPAGTCMSATTEAGATWQAAISVSCDPLELVFAAFDSSAGGCSCCPGSPPKAFQLTVTA